MPLNKTKGDMYPWIDYTWNPLAGRCSHNCEYCYMNTPPQSWLDKYKGKQRQYEKELKTDLYKHGKGKTIFVCSGNDLFANNVDYIDIKGILNRCKEFSENTYLFQTKNPKKMRVGFNTWEFPQNKIIGTTIESNWCFNLSDAPEQYKRKSEIETFSKTGNKVMISIEPILDFQLEVFTKWIKDIDPDFVSIGANSNNRVDLPEPSGTEVIALYENIKDFTEVKIKKNLKRLWDFEDVQDIILKNLIC